MGDTIDINVQNTIEEVTIVATPNNYIININRVIGEQVQSDWNQNDDQSPDYIKNKPIIPAEQINSDWNATSGKAEILNKPAIPSISGLATVSYVDQQDALKVDKVAGSRLITSAEGTILNNTSGTNTGDETTSTIKSKLGITTLSGSNTGDETITTIKSKLGITTLSGSNTGDETATTIKSKLGITTLSGSNTGDQDLSGFVPYTNADSNVNIGEYDLYLNKLWLYDQVNENHGSIHFTDTDFHIEDADGHKMLVIEDGFMQIHLSDTIQSNLFTSNLTETRDHYLPDTSGTIALTSDITGTNSGVNTGDETASTIKSKLGITTLSGSNTGDQDLTGLVVKNAPIIEATKTKITYDSKGLVTSGADATTNDIADSTNKRYQTDNQRTFNDATSSIQTQLNAKPSFTAPNQQVYTGTVTWTGTTAPSGTINHSYNWIRIGNLVILKINSMYSVAGTLLTRIQYTIPTDCPTPIFPTGFGLTANDNIYEGSGLLLIGTTNTPAVVSRVIMFRNSTNTNNVISVQSSAASYLASQLTIQYFTS